uniref:Uncharacterized protein n=1 Tax=Globodera rostochiensis TaxID=31243 RepID=A0A914I574_GLORO
MKCQLMFLLISLGIASSIQFSPRSRRATVLEGGNLVIVDGNVHVVNGQVISGNGCYYHKDKVTDNGKTRAMTKAERVQLDNRRCSRCSPRPFRLEGRRDRFRCWSCRRCHVSAPRQLVLRNEANAAASCLLCVIRRKGCL